KPGSLASLGYAIGLDSARARLLRRVARSRRRWLTRPYTFCTVERTLLTDWRRNVLAVAIRGASMIRFHVAIALALAVPFSCINAVGKCATGTVTVQGVVQNLPSNASQPD